MPDAAAGAGIGDDGVWIAALSRAESDVEHADAVARLHQLLVRVARADAHRRAPTLGVAGPELEDLVQQAADDALLAILRKLGQFRGESRFATWVYKFVVYEVGAKMNRHRWHRESMVDGGRGWEELPARFGMDPQHRAEWGELMASLRRAVEHKLSDRQRTVFLAIVVDGEPLDVLAARIDSNRNAIYKVMFDARVKIRAALVADGLIRHDATGERAGGHT